MPTRRTLVVGLIGHNFMGRAHSNAWRQAPRFFELAADVRMKTICGRDRKKARAAAVSLGWESSALDWRKWTFLNADLSVSMAREPVGEWILLDAVTWIGPDGAGLAMARLADTKGYFGRCAQSLVIEKR